MCICSDQAAACSCSVSQTCARSRMRSTLECRPLRDVAAVMMRESSLPTYKSLNARSCSGTASAWHRLDAQGLRGHRTARGLVSILTGQVRGRRTQVRNVFRVPIPTPRNADPGATIAPGVLSWAWVAVARSCGRRWRREGLHRADGTDASLSRMLKTRQGEGTGPSPRALLCSAGWSCPRGARHVPFKMLP